MLKFQLHLTCLFLALLPTNSTAQEVLTYPKSATTNIFVSTDTVSTWTETAAQDYLIPNSQVFVTGRGSNAAKYMGLLGVAIDRSQNQSAMEPAGDSLRLNFASDLVRILKAKISSSQLASTSNVIDAAEVAHLKLLPSAKLTLSEDGTARLTFRLTIRFNDAVTNSEVKKEFYYSHGDIRNLFGPNSWSDEQGKHVRTVAEEAFGQVAAALLDDLAGTFTSAFEPGKQRYASYSAVGMNTKATRSLILKEYPNHIAVAPIFGERAPRGFVLILERRAVVLQPL